MTRKHKFVKRSTYVAKENNHGCNIADKHKLPQRKHRMTKQAAAVEGSTGAMATMTFLMSRKIENPSVPGGRNRKNRKEQEQMNLTSIWRIRLGSSMKTMYVQIETKAIGRRVSKAADNDKLK